MKTEDIFSNAAVKWRVRIEDVERKEATELVLGRRKDGKLEWAGRVLTAREMGLRIGVLLEKGS